MDQTRPDTPPVPTDLLILSADAFVHAASTRLGLSLAPREAVALSQSILRGANKSRVWGTLVARRDNRPPARAATLPGVIMHAPDGVAVEDVLIAYAPDDDRAFLAYAFERLVGRDAEPQERLELEFDLRRGLMDRRAAIARVADCARADGRVPLIGRLTTTSALQRLNHDHPRNIGLVRRIAGGEYLLAEDTLVQEVEMTPEGWGVESGRLLAGPARSLKSGVWRLKIDLIQDQAAVLDIDVWTDAGLEAAARLRLVGAAALTQEFIIEPATLMAEIVVTAVRGPTPRWVLTPRELSATWVGEA